MIRPATADDAFFIALATTLAGDERPEPEATLDQNIIDDIASLLQDVDPEIASMKGVSPQALALGWQRASSASGNMSYVNAVVDLDASGINVRGVCLGYILDTDSNFDRQAHLDDTTPVDRFYAPIFELKKLLPLMSFYLHDLAVFPAYRRQGVGQALLGHSIDRAKSLSSPNISLIVDDTKEGAMALYVSLGFRELARRPFVTIEGSEGSDPTTWILMTRDLND